MRQSKKFLLIGTLCVVLVAGVLGGVAIVNADDEGTPTAAPPAMNQTNLMEKVAEIYEQNTGTAIDPTELQNAFIEAGAAIRTEAQDTFLQKLVDEGKITQEQADAWKTWLEARPDKALSDEFKAWFDSRPDLPALFGEGNLKGGMMPFGGGHRGFGGVKGGMGFGFRDCPLDTSEE